MTRLMCQSKRPDAVYILAALLAIMAHGAVFAISWQSPPSVKLHVQGAPGVEIRLSAIAAPRAKNPPVAQVNAQPEPPAPKVTPQNLQPALPPQNANPRPTTASAPAPESSAPERSTPQVATSPAPLKSLDNKQPRYPILARKRGQEGSVTLLVKVDAEGVVKSVSIQKGSGHSLLDKSAADAVKKWHFSPARLNDVPVAGSALVTVEFRLE